MYNNYIPNPILRMRAKEKLRNNGGTLAKATFIYGAIYVGIVFAIMMVFLKNSEANGAYESIEKFQAYMESMNTDFKFQAISSVVIMIIQALMATLLAGIQFMCLNVARDKEIKVSDVFYAIKNNPDKIIILDLIVSIASLLLSLPSEFLYYFASLGSGREGLLPVASLLDLASTVFSIWLTIKMSQCIFVFLDNPYESVSSIIKKSFDLMKMSAGRYILMWLAFIPYIIISVFTFGLLLLWALPYQQTSLAMLYIELNGEFEQRANINEEEVV